MKTATVSIDRAPFGVTPGGEEVQLFSLENDQGMRVKIIDYGGTITHIDVPDRSGRIADVVLGHDNLEGYLNRSRYFGALIGRYANRIARGCFDLNGVGYSLATNNGANHLHGGLRGFDKVVWEAVEIGDGVRLSYLSKDGEENYPGNVRATVAYSLTETNELRIEYVATTDKDTIINLTNHSYFNLAGSGTILDHEVTINADAFTPVDETLIPTGEIRDVKDTPMDFTSATAIGARINSAYEQVRIAGGYDHNFVLRGEVGELNTAATLHDPKSGRLMEVSTTQPGMQFYSGNFLDGSLVGKGGRVYVKNAGCCFETQHFPDSPNHPGFPSTVLNTGEEYRQTTVYRFSAD
ncbi:MAG TPA: aldose epimerase family protein [Pyrinomonadaceae bacterium]|nr:aldose epimerase family protein [Pyrinomonadaceae bacterium]